MSRAQKNIQLLFHPKSIAVIGASRNPQKVGGAVLDNLIKSGYKGRLFAVNPSADEILGVKSYKSVKLIKEKIDLAIIIIPAQFAGSILKECGEAGIKAAIIISSGFREIGEEGKTREQEIIKIADKYGIALLGPNCLGVINTKNNLNASFASSFPMRGNIALISQSGAIVSSLIDWGNENNLGFSKIVSLGNKAGINENDVLEYFARDKETGVIALYLETISYGKKFIEIAKKISLDKPIIVLKTGVSQIGQAASQSHTGALATEDRIVDAALRKGGVIRVFNTKDLLRVSQLMAFKNKISRSIFVVSNAGGLAVSSADIASSNNLDFAKIRKEDANKIKKIIPKFLSAENPLDIGGDAKSDRYGKILNVICMSRNFPALPKGRVKRGCPPVVLAIITPQKMTDFVNIAREIIKFNKKNSLILPILAGGEKIKEARNILIKKGVPVYDFPEESLHILDIIYDNYNDAEKTLAESRQSGIAKKKFACIKKNIQRYSNEWISLDDTLKIAENLDLPIVKSVAAKLQGELDAAIKKIGFPLVAKTSVGSIVHKAKSGQVVCGINNKKDLLNAFNKIKKPVIIQRQGKKDIELIIGAKRDKNFGAMLMFGLGGIMANEFNQVRFYMMPLNPYEIQKIIDDFPIKKIFSDPIIQEIAKTIYSLQKLILNFPQISEVDLNPVMVNLSEEKIICPDVKIRVS